MSTKTDNHSTPSKLALRRYFIQKYHQEQQPRVIDCCMGNGVLWKTLSEDHPVDYWGLDIKRKKGRLAIDSSKVLAQPGWKADIVDVDTYGSPWKHWKALVDHTQTDLTVFLTIGLVRVGGGTYDMAAFQLAGIRLAVPNSLGAMVSDRIFMHIIFGGLREDQKIIEIIEAENRGNARYIGLRLTTSNAAIASEDSQNKGFPTIK